MQSTDTDIHAVGLTKPVLMPPYLLRALILLGSLPVLLLLFTDVADLRAGGFLHSGHMWGRDFVNAWTGARLTVEGRTDILYSPNEYVAYLQQAMGPLKPHYYSYPPSSLLLVAPLGLLPYFPALALWIGGTLAFFLWAARPYVRDVPGFPLAVAALTPAATVNIWAGHYGFLIGALWLAALSRIATQPKRAGLFAALMTIKPHLGLLLPLVLLGRRAWTAIAIAVAGTIALLLLSGGLFGFGLWYEYLTKMSVLQANLLADRHSFFLAMMPGTFTMVHWTLGLPTALAWALHAAGAGAALALCWSAWRSGASDRELAFIGATATFLILPYGFNYDMTVASLGFALLMFAQWGRLRWFERCALIGGFLAPQMTFASGLVHLPLTPVLLLAGLYVQVRLCGAAKRPVPALRPATAA